MSSDYSFLEIAEEHRRGISPNSRSDMMNRETSAERTPSKKRTVSREMDARFGEDPGEMLTLRCVYPAHQYTAVIPHCLFALPATKDADHEIDLVNFLQYKRSPQHGMPYRASKNQQAAPRAE